MAYGITIEAYLMDGDASGRWSATLSQWNGIVYKIPRSHLKRCDNQSELNTPGVYFLFGLDDKTGQKFIYVGEADDVLKRLSQPHTFERDDTYWTEAVVYVTNDGFLEKGRIKYLENRFYTIAKETKRYEVKNMNTPTQSPVSRSVQDSLEIAIMNVKLILPALGHDVFEEVLSQHKDSREIEDDLLYFQRNDGKGGKATGKIMSDGFWVLKGSYICPETARYFSKNFKNLREKYAKVVNKKGILMEDVRFGSPSYAAAFVCGKSSNGLIEWKNKEGISLKDMDNTSDFRENHGVGEDQVGGEKQTEAGRKKAEAETTKKAETDIKQSDKVEFLYIRGKKCVATGYVSEVGFTICKGSTYAIEERPSCPRGIHDCRLKLMREGKMENGTFTEDVSFSSPSKAAGCIVGGSANGQQMWVDEAGISLKEKK